ncbi:MAG: hypothetical protein ACOYOA_16035, partial [Saprospiraceae bacterium]
YAMNINPQSPSGVFSDQGACGIGNKQSGNKFMTSCISQSTNRNHINSTINFQYHFREGYTNEEPICVSNINLKKKCRIFFQEINANSCYVPCSGCDDNGLIDTIATSSGREKQLLQEKLLNLYIANAEEDKSTEILSLIEELDVNDDPSTYVGALIDFDEYTTAQTLITALPNTDDGNALRYIYQIALDLQEQHHTVFELSETQIDDIRTIAIGSTKAKHFAQSILYARGEDLLDIPIEPTIVEEDPEEFQKANLLLLVSNQLSIVPNPSNGIAVVNWTFSPGITDGVLKIVNTEGKTIKSHNCIGYFGYFDLGELNLPAGIYFAKLLSAIDEKAVKFIITN